VISPSRTVTKVQAQVVTSNLFCDTPPSISLLNTLTNSHTTYSGKTLPAYYTCSLCLIHVVISHLTVCGLFRSRNQDFQEINFELDGQAVLRFALAYGFRNIQNIVQKLKRGKLSYHYVEIMACPSGIYVSLYTISGM
jgi:hypothetical protein